MNEIIILNPILGSFEKMDLKSIASKLDDLKTYQEFPKPVFLQKLTRVFDQFKRLGNTQLKMYKANCLDQTNDKFAYLFIGNNSTKHITLYFQVKNNTIIDIGECVDFESDRKSLNKIDQILLDDWMAEAEEEGMRDSFKSLEIMRGNMEPKYVMKRKDLSMYLKKYKPKFDSIDFKDKSKLFETFPNQTDEIDEENIFIFYRKYIVFRSYYKLMTGKVLISNLIKEISDIIKSNDKSNAIDWYQKHKAFFKEMEIAKFAFLMYDETSKYDQVYRDYWVSCSDVIHVAKLAQISIIFDLQLEPIIGVEENKQSLMSELRSALNISYY
jgi:hypothetical protein